MNRRGISGVSCSSQQKNIQLAGEILPVALALRWRAAGINTAFTQRIHKVAHLQSGLYGVRGKEFAPGMQGVAAFCQNHGRQGYIGGNNQITALELFHYLVVGTVKTLGHAEKFYAGRSRDAKGLIGDQGQHDAGPLCGTEQNFLDCRRAGISINPYSHLRGHRLLFFVAFTLAGGTCLVGGTLGVIAQLVVAAAPFGTYLTDTFNNFLALTGRTGGTFFFGHVFLLSVVW